jgi:hypothetical protein
MAQALLRSILMAHQFQLPRLMMARSQGCKSRICRDHSSRSTNDFAHAVLTTGLPTCSCGSTSQAGSFLRKYSLECNSSRLLEESAPSDQPCAEMCPEIERLKSECIYDYFLSIRRQLDGRLHRFEWDQASVRCDCKLPVADPRLTIKGSSIAFYFIHLAEFSRSSAGQASPPIHTLRLSAVLLATACHINEFAVFFLHNLNNQNCQKGRT